MDNDKLFELISEMYGEMQEGFKEVNSKIDKLDIKINKLDGRTTIIEEDHGKKLDLLFDGYKQNADKLDRIEDEVSKHEEVIIRRIK